MKFWTNWSLIEANGVLGSFLLLEPDGNFFGGFRAKSSGRLQQSDRWNSGSSKNRLLWNGRVSWRACASS